MKLDPELQPLLLELATLRRAADVPAVSREEDAELDKAIKERDRMRAAASSAQLAVSDMELEILRIQEDERKLRRRADDDKRQLSAEVNEERRKDLKHDYVVAKSLLADLMSELQEAHNEIHALRNNKERHDAALAEAEERVGAAQRAVDALPEDNPGERIAQLTELLPAEVIEEFEAQRLENGVGVAQFNGRSCGGCFIVLPPADSSRIRQTPAGELPQCPDCGSYLVRSA